MSDVVKWEELKDKIEERKEELKKEDSIWGKTKKKAKEITKWVIENPEKVAAIASGTLLAVKTVSKITGKARDWHHREMTQWDPSSRQQLTLRRPMTKREKLIFADRVSHGGGTYNTLKDMGLI